MRARITHTRTYAFSNVGHSRSALSALINNTHNTTAPTGIGRLVPLRSPSVAATVRGFDHDAPTAVCSSCHVLRPLGPFLIGTTVRRGRAWRCSGRSSWNSAWLTPRESVVVVVVVVVFAVVDVILPPCMLSSSSNAQSLGRFSPCLFVPTATVVIECLSSHIHVHV